MITVGLSYIRKHSWCLAYSQISTIWVSSKKNQKSYIDWPQQPPTEKVPNISEKLHFWWSIPQKGTSIGHGMPGIILPPGLVMFLMKWGCWGHWGLWGCCGCWGHWGCRDSKARKITTGDFRVIEVLEFSFILVFWKNIFGGRIMKYQVEI